MPPPRDRTPSHGAEDDSLPDRLLNHLFAASIDVHQTLRLIDRDTDQARHLDSALARLDETITTITGVAATRAATGGPTLQRLVTDAFTALSCGLVAEFDLTGYLRTLTAHGTGLPDVRATAVLLDDVRGAPDPVVVTPEQLPLLELCRLRPSPVWETQTVTDLATDIRWPLFAARANAAGCRAVHTTPLRLRHTVFGTLVLFRATPGGLFEEHDRVAHALADLATLGVLVHLADVAHAVLTDVPEPAVLGTHPRPDPTPADP